MNESIKACFDALRWRVDNFHAVTAVLLGDYCTYVAVVILLINTRVTGTTRFFRLFESFYSKQTCPYQRWRDNV